MFTPLWLRIVSGVFRVLRAKYNTNAAVFSKNQAHKEKEKKYTVEENTVVCMSTEAVLELNLQIVSKKSMALYTSANFLLTVCTTLIQNINRNGPNLVVMNIRLHAG